MGLEKWSQAEQALQKILQSQPHHQVALYQLSQVYLEQNKTRLALESIRSSAKHGCNHQQLHSEMKTTAEESFDSTVPSTAKCIWGPKCTPKAHLCAQIVIQEADILRSMRQYQLAAQVQHIDTFPKRLLENKKK